MKVTKYIFASYLVLFPSKKHWEWTLSLWENAKALKYNFSSDNSLAAPYEDEYIMMNFHFGVYI